MTKDEAMAVSTFYGHQVEVTDAHGVLVRGLVTSGRWFDTGDPETGWQTELTIVVIGR